MRPLVILKEIHENYKRIAHKRSTTIALDVHVDVPYAIEADVLKVTQVITVTECSSTYLIGASHSA